MAVSVPKASLIKNRAVSNLVKAQTSSRSCWDCTAYTPEGPETQSLSPSAAL